MSFKSAELMSFYTDAHSLNLALLVHAEDQRVIGRVQVEPHDVAHFLDEQRVGRQFEGLGAMRLQAEGAPNAADGHTTEPAGLSQTAGAPMGLPARRAFQ